MTSLFPNLENTERLNRKLLASAQARRATLLERLKHATDPRWIAEMQGRIARLERLIELTEQDLAEIEKQRKDGE